LRLCIDNGGKGWWDNDCFYYFVLKQEKEIKAQMKQHLISE